MWASIPYALGSNFQETSSELYVVRAIAPKYPSLAAIANVSGSVIVEVQVDENGYISTTKIVDGHKLLQDVAEYSAKQWRFNSRSGRVAILTHLKLLLYYQKQILLQK
jgi:TonB family protein